MNTHIQRYGNIIKETAKNWLDDDAPSMGASLAFYSIISIGPLLMVVITICSLVFGREVAAEKIITSLGGLVGSSGAEAIKTIIENTGQKEKSLIATIVGIITLIFGTSGVFGELQSALNTIWQVKPKTQGLIALVCRRFFSFTLVLGTGFLLLISLVISTGLSALGDMFTGHFPEWELVMHILDIVVSFGVITLLFAMIFKVVPDIQVKWNDVWVGAILTALLFTIGKFLIGFYLGQSNVTTTYGAAGSLIVLLLWVYYSSQILFFGAELTEVYAYRYGSGATPGKNAIKV